MQKVLLISHMTHRITPLPLKNSLLGIVAIGYARVWVDGLLHMNDTDAQIAALLRVPVGKWVSIIPFCVPAKKHCIERKEII